MALTTTTDDTTEQCGRCEGWRFKTYLDDGICTACYREAHRLSCYQVSEDGMMNISVKMYYDHFKWHFEKALKDKVRGTRLVFAPFSASALHTFRDYMMVVNPALYIPPPKQVAGMRGGNRSVWRIRITDGVQFTSAMSDPDRDRLRQGHSGELRGGGGAYVCWIPPLTLEVVIVKSGAGKEYGTCAISSGAARLTGVGFSFAPRIPAQKFLAAAQNVCALAVFGIQQDRVTENARRAQQAQVVQVPPEGLLPRELLVMASKYL
jgi:hypothetical protein